VGVRVSPENLHAVASLTRDPRFIRLLDDIRLEKSRALDAVIHAPISELADARARLVAVSNLLQSIESAETMAKDMERNQSIANTGTDRVS
jgi:hypothetical protein